MSTNSSQSDADADRTDAEPAGRARPSMGKGSSGRDPASQGRLSSSMGSSPPGLEDLNIPRTVLKDKYEFLTVLGAGGAGVIYKARQHSLGRLVAVKMIHSHLMSPTAVRRFHQEAKTISTLSHPNIISVYDFGISEDNQPFMVMDYVEGTVLSEYLKQEGNLPQSLVKSIAIQLCDGLSHAHMRGVLHRDLKPGNIMLVQMDNGQQLVKILDFGLAKVVFEDGDEGGEQDHLTRTGETVGTPAFMSPEQVMGKNVDHRTDLYSLGCVLYQCLTGDPPLVGETKMETMLMHLNTPPEPINIPHFEPIVSPYLEAIILKLLEKNPVDRFQSMFDLKEALEGKNTTFLLKNRSPARLAELEDPLWQHIGDAVSSVDRRDDESETSLSEPLTGEFGLPSQDASIIDETLFDSQIQSAPDLVADEEEQVGWWSSPKVALLAVPLCFLLGLGGFALFSNMQSQHKDKVAKKIKKGADPFNGFEFADQQLDGWIQSHPNTRKVSSRYEPISDNALVHLGNLQNLEILELYNPKDAAIENLNKITVKGLETIKGHPKIKSVDISQTQITDDVSQVLQTLPALQTLKLNNDKMLTDEVIHGIAGASYLRELELANDEISDQNISELAKLKELKVLDLSGTKITDRALDTIGKLKELEKLTLSKTAITDGGVARLAGLKKLKQIDLSGTGVSDEMAKTLVKMPMLDVIYLSGTKISDKTMEILSKKDWIGYIDVKGTAVTAKGALSVQTKLPSCTVETGVKTDDTGE